jgi:glycerophosphoryl diester phosphodiesterase
MSDATRHGIQSLSSISRPLIVAHRGFRARYPENTLAAFQAAVEVGADMIELDVTLTRDRKLVVIHDDTLDRTTTGKGPVCEILLETVKRLDAGSWFDPRFAGAQIPTLEEVLDAVGKKILINIEIKPEAFEPDAPLDAVERQVLALVQAKHLVDTVLISSFEWRILGRLAGAANAPALALLSEEPADETCLKACQDMGAFSWHPNYRKIDPTQVKQLHEAGIRVFPWTVNSAKKIGQLLDMGVDGIITDDPRLMKKMPPWG